MRLVLKVAVGAVLAIAVLVVAYVLLSGGDDGSDNNKSPAAQARKDTRPTAKRPSASAKAPATPSAPPKVIRAKRASGKYVVAEVIGTVRKPSRAKIRVSAAPPQKVSVAYTLVCNKGGKAVSAGGRFNEKTLFTKDLPTPKGVSSCEVSASAQLLGNGRVKVSVLG